MNIKLSIAEDVTEVADFRCLSSGGDIEKAMKGVERSMRTGKVFVACRRGKVIASLYLTLKKPWAIDPSYFTPVATPLYLLGMAVAPSLQRMGIGRLCLIEAEKIARQWPVDAIRLDAYDNPTGAGGFYQRCGYRECNRVVYRQTPLIYFEKLLAT